MGGEEVINTRKKDRDLQQHATKLQQTIDDLTAELKATKQKLSDEEADHRASIAKLGKSRATVESRTQLMDTLNKAGMKKKRDLEATTLALSESDFTLRRSIDERQMLQKGLDDTTANA